MPHNHDRHAVAIASRDAALQEVDADFLRRMMLLGMELAERKRQILARFAEGQDTVAHMELRQAIADVGAQLGAQVNAVARDVAALRRQIDRATAA